MVAGIVSCLAIWRPSLLAADKVPEKATAETRQKVRRAKLDVNSASAHELATLPGLSPEVADRIVQNRPYRKLDDLVTRKVLGKKEFARIREFIAVRRAR